MNHDLEKLLTLRFNNNYLRQQGALEILQGKPLGRATAAIGRATGLTQRRIQQINKKRVDLIFAGQTDFFVGG